MHRALTILIHLIHTIIPKKRHSHFHCTDEKARIQRLSYLPKNPQIVFGDS